MNVHKVSKWLDTGFNGSVLSFALVLFIGAVTPAHADDLYPVTGYTTADPVDATRFGLALSDGRYRVEAPGGCSDFTTYENVTVWLTDAPDWVMLSPTDADTPTCNVHVLRLIDDTPCFATDAGRCDVSRELSDTE